MNPGVAIAILDPSGSGDDVAETVEVAMGLTPTGRHLACVWETPSLLMPQPPIEATVAQIVLGSPSERTEDKATEPWTLATTLAVRQYGSDLTLMATSAGIIMRRGGDPAYRRLRTEPELRTDEIPSRHPVFTRDVANNVWHVLNEDATDRIAARIASLTAWRDEDILVVAKSTATVRNDLWDRGLALDLVGVAQKVAYEWDEEHSGPGQLRLAAT